MGGEGGGLVCLLFVLVDEGEDYNDCGCEQGPGEKDQFPEADRPGFAPERGGRRAALESSIFGFG